MLVVPVLLAALLATGCGETTIDSAKAEKFIADTVTDQVGAEVESVECPEGLVAKQGETFDCTVTGTDGSSGKAEVTEKDDKGNVNVSAQFVHVRDLEEEIGGGLGEQIGGKVEVTCPEIVVGEKGGKFECEATSGGESAVVAVTQTDDQGNVEYKLEQ